MLTAKKRPNKIQVKAVINQPSRMILLNIIHSSISARCRLENGFKHVKPPKTIWTVLNRGRFP